MDAVFGANRHKLSAALRSSSSADITTTRTTDAGGDRVVVWLKGGPSAERFDSDHEPVFRQESYFWYLTGVKEPDCMVVLECATTAREEDAAAGDESTTTLQTTLLVPRHPPEYATIMGRIRSLDEWKEMYSVEAVRYTDELDQVLSEALQLTEKPGSPSFNTSGTDNTSSTTYATKQRLLLLMKGRNSDSGNMYEPPVVENQEIAQYVDTETLFPILAECRVTKSPAELHLLRQVTEITSFAHAYVMRNFRPGMMEYQAESLFRHYCYYNYGCRLVGYTSICGCGPNAAVLHYGHAGEPNARQSARDDMGLFDMGAEYCGYGSDITCSWPVAGRFTDRQRVVFQAVYRAQVAVYTLLKPGVSWVDCHKAAEAAILQDLIVASIVLLPSDQSVDDLVEQRLGAVFMPHGLGHFIGIDTHDVGGLTLTHPLPHHLRSQ